MLAPMSSRLVSPTLIGRGEALAAAEEMLRRIGAGHAAHLLVAGEAGIGKTRFSEAVSDLAIGDGFQVLRGGCVHLESGELPYAPFSEALRELARRLDPRVLATIIADDGAVLSRVTPALGPRQTRAAESPPSEAPRGHLMEALLGLFARLAADAPVLFVVEDLHWADSASLDALAFLLRTLRDHPIGLVLTFRSDELHRRHPLRPWLGEIERLGSVDRLELAPLEPAQTGELIAAIRGVEATPELVERIQDRSDGNPFFIEELLAQGDQRVGRSALSPGMRDILLARVESVPDDAQTILAVAAAMGRRVDSALLKQVSALSPAAFDKGLAACLERRLLVVDDLGTRDRLGLRHALIAEVVYDGILPDHRTRLHRAIAEALAIRIAAPGPTEPGAWAELAGHWYGAHDEARALEAALHAADEAEQAFAWAAALAQYHRALAGWELVPDPEEIAGFDRVELLSRAAMAASPGEPTGAAVPLLREAIVEADGQGDIARGALLRGRLGLALWFDGRPVEARVAYQEALAMVPPDPPTVERAWILARFAQGLMLDGSERESQGLAEAAIAMAREVGDRRIETHALNTLGCDLGCLGQCELGAENMERALEIALELGDPDNIERAYNNATEVLAICGHDERAIELAREGIERSRALGMGEVDGALIGFHAAEVLYDAGRWSEAASLLIDGRLDVPATDVRVLPLADTVEALAKNVQLDVGTGDWDAAARKLTWVREQLRDGFETEYQYTGPYASACAELALWQGRPREALAAIEEVLPRLEQTDDIRYRMRLLRLGTRAAADLAEIARDRRDRAAEKEAEGIAASLRTRSASAVAVIASMDGGLALELEAEELTVVAEETRLRGVSDPGAWSDAAAGWSARGRPYHRAYARYREGEGRLAAGDRGGAAEALEEARSIASALGAGPLLGTVGALARRARIRLDRPLVDGTVSSKPGRDDHAGAVATELALTPREREVLELVAQGMTNRQIAGALYISVHTAGIHVSRILSKLGATSRTEAASRAYRLGLVAR
jgi:DNA-binding CsgD family transcriptional regulator/tetratricopeptide (TPR) repeat protein